MDENTVQALRVTPRREITDMQLPQGSKQLAAMYQALGCTTVEPVVLADDLTMWCDEDGFAKNPVVNVCVTGVAARHGRIDQPCVGTVLFTGGAGPDEETLGLRPHQALDLRTACEAVIRSVVIYRAGNPACSVLDEVRAVQAEGLSGVGLGAR
jgi:hypothetical protein